MGACAANHADCNGMASDGCEADTNHDPSNCGHCGCTCGTGDATLCGTNQHVEPIPNGAPGCSGGLCAIGSCDPGWGDCNGVLSDGCETPIDTNENCGACGMACDPSLTCMCSMQNGKTGCSCDSVDASPE